MKRLSHSITLDTVKVANTDMLKLAILFANFLLANCVVHHMPRFRDIEDNDLSNPSLPGFIIFRVRVEDPLWVLKLNDDTLDFGKLRTANAREQRDFEMVAAPLIARRRHQIPSVVKKDDPTKNEDAGTTRKNKMIDTYKIKQEIGRIINKFVLSTREDPDVYLSESDEEEGSSLMLYFKGPYTSLLVTSGRKQWHYFIGPPSPLPAWFYERHYDVTTDGNTAYVDIPEAVRDDFYGKILHMLQAFLGFPV